MTKPHPTDEALLKEFDRWDKHQEGCAYLKKGKWIVLPCDMNCKNVFEGIISSALATVRAESVKEEREKWSKRIDSIMAEFGDNPVQCLQIIDEALNSKSEIEY